MELNKKNVIWGTIIETIIVLLGLLAAFFLIRGMISLSIQDIAELSRAKWDCHLGLARNLVRQRSDTIIGFSLLLLSFIFQLFSMFRSKAISKLDKKVIFITIIIFTLITFLCANWVSNILYKTSYKQIEYILKK